MNIYVGNLPYNMSENDLRAAFEAYGTVTKVSIIKDKFSGESRGFAFVEMASDDEARAAISGLADKEINGRTLRINEARPRDDRDDRGGRGGGGGGRGGGRGGDRGDRGDRGRRG